MNAERRQAAIEAGAAVLYERRWNDPWDKASDVEREHYLAAAAAVIDAAAPHLVGKPVGYALMLGRVPIGGYFSLELALHAKRSEKWAFPVGRVVALVPVEVEEP